MLRTRCHRLRLPPGNGSSAFALSVMPGNNRHKFNRGRQLAALLKGVADRGGFFIGDHEHLESMGSRSPNGEHRTGAGSTGIVIAAARHGR